MTALEQAWMEWARGYGSALSKREEEENGQTADTSPATADARRSAGEHSASGTRLADARGDAEGTSNRKKRGKANACGDDARFVVGDATTSQ